MTNPKLYKRPKWSIEQVVRLSGLLEEVCEHQVGHPNKDFLDQHPEYVKKGYGIHGCDGCCGQDYESEK